MLTALTCRPDAGTAVSVRPEGNMNLWSMFITRWQISVYNHSKCWKKKYIQSESLPGMSAVCWWRRSLGGIQNESLITDLCSWRFVTQLQSDSSDTFKLTLLYFTLLFLHPLRPSLYCFLLSILTHSSFKILPPPLLLHHSVTWRRQKVHQKFNFKP